MQLTLSFATQNQEKFTEKNFIINPENSSAYKFLEKFFNQDNYDSVQFPTIIVKGEEYSGKTHLLNIFANKYNAEFINKEIFYFCDKIISLFYLNLNSYEISFKTPYYIN